MWRKSVLRISRDSMSQGLQWIRKQAKQLLAQSPNRRSANVVLVGILVVGMFSAGLSLLATAYNEHQKRIPQALSSEASSQYAPAADAVTTDDKASATPTDLATRLASQRVELTQGKTPDRRHIKLLEHRDENSRV